MEKLVQDGMPYATPNSPDARTGPIMLSQYPGRPSMRRIASVSLRIRNPLFVDEITGSWCSMSQPATGRKVRVSASMGWPSGSSAMPSVISTIDQSGSGS